MARDALIVGINQYQSLPKLTAAAKDAEGIANILETQSEFRVQRLPEIIENHRPSIGQQASILAQHLEKSLVNLLLPKGNHIPEAVFFYFSGHGLQREKGIREGYLATSDTHPEHSNSGISLSWLRRLIKHSPIRQIIVILDCCHSGEFLSLRDESWQSSDGQSSLFIAASREYEAAYESLDSDYSVLTQAVLSGLDPQQSASGRITSTDLVASITNQLRNEIQQPLFEQSGSEIIITCQPERSIPKSESLSIISRLRQYSLNFCPYRGPQPFEEKHAEYYFGRENLIHELLNALQTTNIHTLVGASGSGKTSLLRAGIIPRLAAGNDIGGSEKWLVRYFTPNTQPLKNLAAAFTVANQEIEVAHQLLQTEELLKREPDGLVHLVTAALLKHSTATKLWLIIDQFEELLMPTTDPQIEKDRQQFIHALLTALRCPSIPLGVMISLRSDAIDGLLAYDELFSLLKGNQSVIPPMNYQEIRDVIEKPAQKLGLKIDPYLVPNLTLDLTGAPGELALLQNTLYELWQHRTSASYSKGEPCLSLNSYIQLGRLSTMVTDRATELYLSLPPEEQAAVKRIFLALCDLGEGRVDQCRPARKLELINQQFPQGLIEQTLQKLVTARLVVVDKSQLVPQTDGQTMAAAAWRTHSHETTDIKHWLVANLPTTPGTLAENIELAHKSLVSDWTFLRQWLQTSRPFLRQRRDLEDRAWIWHQRGEPQSSDYLLGQQYLKDVSRFLQTHPKDLSALTQRFVDISQRTVTQQRWQSRGVAVLLPIAVMTGMTVSLVRNQLAIFWRVKPEQSAQLQSGATVSTALSPILPENWGLIGADHLAVTSQILDFNQRHPQSEISQVPVAQLASLMRSGTLITNSTLIVAD